LKIALVGVGLIGGSIGLAARERLDASVAAYDSSGEALQVALQRGAIDRASDDVSGAVSDADAVFVAAPVGVLPELTAAALAAVPEDCVVTDVGSTKRAIVAALDAGGVSEARAGGGQPLGWVGAGIERPGGLRDEHVREHVRQVRDRGQQRVVGLGVDRGRAGTEPVQEPVQPLVEDSRGARGGRQVPGGAVEQVRARVPDPRGLGAGERVTAHELRFPPNR